MTGYIVDASVAFEYLLRTPLGLTVAHTIEGAFLAAPELMDVEVLSALRRQVLLGQLEESRARMVVDDLAEWPIDRLPHRNLARSAWEHFENISAYDSFYVAAAHALGFPLLTSDGKLARAAGLDIPVYHLRV